ncbi:MAG: hypothetical protein AAF564_17855 [Bacteroidota bacterium]
MTMEAKKERVVSLLSEKELELLKTAANKSERSLSSFVRLAALKEAWRYVNEEKPELEYS